MTCASFYCARSTHSQFATIFLGLSLPIKPATHFTAVFPTFCVNEIRTKLFSRRYINFPKNFPPFSRCVDDTRFIFQKQQLWFLDDSGNTISCIAFYRVNNKLFNSIAREIVFPRLYLNQAKPSLQWKKQQKHYLLRRKVDTHTSLREVYFQIKKRGNRQFV